MKDVNRVTVFDMIIAFIILAIIVLACMVVVVGLVRLLLWLLGVA